MVLTIDIGNSNITLGVFQDSELKLVSRIAADLTKTEDQYAVDLQNILSLYGYKAQIQKGAVLSSVVPALQPVLRQAVLKLFPGIRVLTVSPGIKTGLDIQIDNASILGSDLVCAAVAVCTLYPLPCITFDFGTATTISAIDQKGKFLGGSIFPGMGVSLEALSVKAAQLPHVSFEGARELIGTNTVDCMRSGILFGTASMVDGMIDRYCEVLGKETTVVATGGFAERIVPYCRHRIQVNPNLILQGLFQIYQKNTGGKERKKNS